MRRSAEDGVEVSGELATDQMSRGEAKRESDEGLAGRQRCSDPGQPGGCSVT